MAFSDELEKQICIKKLLKWANKRQNNFNIYNAALKKTTTTGNIVILHLCTKTFHDMIYSSWDIERDRPKLVILGHFLLFTLLKSKKNSKLWKNEKKKTPGDIVVLHMCTINDNHMMYGFWDMERDELNFLSFWTIFCPFTPIETWKIKILKRWKKRVEIL